MRSFIQFLLFQLQWWLCVLHTVPYFSYGYLIALCLAFFSLYRNHFQWNQLIAIMAMALVGFLNDMSLRSWGIFIFGDSLWLGVLWLCFAVWFYQTSWLHQKYILTPLLFMLFGPLSYFGGSHFGALRISTFSPVTLKIIFLDWFFLGIVFLIMSKVPSFLKKR